MPRRQKKGQGPRTRGRHKHHKSLETRKWNRMLKLKGVNTKP